MEEGQKLFKTSLFGFRKEDVFRYVEELNERLSDSEDRASALTTECKNVNDKLNIALQKNDKDTARYTEELRALATELDKAKGETASISSEAAKLRFQTEQDRIRLTDYAKRLQEAEELMASLKEKAEKYDRQMGKISEVMVLVRTEAESILKKAQEDADEVHRKAQLEIDKTNVMIEGFKEKYMAVKTTFANSLDDMKGLFDSAYNSVGETVHSVEPLPKDWMEELNEEEQVGEKAEL